MTRSERAALSGAALNNMDIMDAAEAMFENIDDVGVRAVTLTTEQNKAVRSLLALFYDETTEKTIKLKGGKDGKDYDQERDRLSIIGRLRFVFGYEPLQQAQLELIASRVNAFKGRGARAPFTGSGLGSGSAVSVSTW